MAFPPGRSPSPTNDPSQLVEPATEANAETPAQPLDDAAMISNDSLAMASNDTIDGEPWLPAAPPAGRSAKRAKRVGWELVQTLVLALIIFVGVRTMAQNFRVEGSSMEPGLHNGQYLLVNKAVYFKLNLKTLSKYIPFIDPGDNPERFIFHGPHRGDVVVFRYPLDPSRDFIKRVIGVPGDVVEIAGGKVSVNGVALEETYVDQNTTCGSTCTYEVPPGQYFVLGDNRPNSSDSRIWGLLPEEYIIGQAMFSYWPFESLGGVGNHSFNLGFVHLLSPF